MGNANFIELETCIEECIQFCEKHTELEFVGIHDGRLIAAKRKFETGIEESDLRFIQWQKESVSEKLKWKKLGQELAATQRELRRVNASTFPDEIVRHWDTELLENYVLKMVAYLEKQESIETASSMKDRLERALQSAKNESAKRAVTLSDYQRFARLRADGLGTLNNVLGDFRVSMRRHLGVDSELYQSIRWPMTLEPDETVL